jgi:hypothetical protein
VAERQVALSPTLNKRESLVILLSHAQGHSQ